MLVYPIGRNREAWIEFLGPEWAIDFLQHTTYNGKPAIMIRASTAGNTTDFYAVDDCDDTR
jgi:hypothetical protein